VAEIKIFLVSVFALQQNAGFPFFLATGTHAAPFSRK